MVRKPHKPVDMSLILKGRPGRGGFGDAKEAFQPSCLVLDKERAAWPRKVVNPSSVPGSKSGLSTELLLSRQGRRMCYPGWYEGL